MARDHVADSIYNRLAVVLACLLLGLTLIVVRCIAGTTGFVVVSRRWVVREDARMARPMAASVQRLHEELPEISEAMVTLAMIRLMLHRLAHPSRKRLSVP